MSDSATTNKTIKVNDTEYNVEDLTNEAKSYISQIQLIDSKIMPMKAELAVFQTARDTYSNTLNIELQKIKPS